MSEPTVAQAQAAKARSSHRLVVSDHTGQRHDTSVEGTEAEVQKVADELAVLAERLGFLGVTRHSRIGVVPN